MSERRWTVEDFEALTPGSALTATILRSARPGTLPHPVRTAWLAAVQRQRNHYDALLNVGVVSVVEALDAPRFLEPPVGDRWDGREELRDLAADEVAARLAWTVVAAGRRVDLARGGGAGRTGTRGHRQLPGLGRALRGRGDRLALAPAGVRRGRRTAGRRLLGRSGRVLRTARSGGLRSGRLGCRGRRGS